MRVNLFFEVHSTPFASYDVHIEPMVGDFIVHEDKKYKVKYRVFRYRKKERGKFQDDEIDVFCREQNGNLDL